MKSKFKLVFCSLLSVCIQINSQAANSNETKFEYPELSVVPRASERIMGEASREQENPLKADATYLVPASMTFVTGLMLLTNGTKSDVETSNTNAKTAPWIGMGVGAAWWAVSYGILRNLHYYSDAAIDVSKLPVKSEREQLIRERRSEEAIHAAANTARRVKWLSIGSNLSASLFMAISAKKQTFPVYLSIASALTSFSPLIFPHRFEEVESLHMDYKKRIYAPILGATVFSSPIDSSLFPGVSLAFQF